MLFFCALTELLNLLMTKTEIMHVPPNTCRIEFAYPTQYGLSSSSGCAINKTLWERTIRRCGCGLVVNAEE